MLANLKLPKPYDGMLFLADAQRNPPLLRSHRHIELELNLIVRGSFTLLVDGRRFHCTQRNLVWLFPAQEHQLLDRTDDAQYFVAVFTPSLIRRVCHGAEYSELRRETAAGGTFQRALLSVESYDLLRRMMDELTSDGLDPDVLNREGGYGANSAFTFQHADPHRLNAGLGYLLLSAWKHHRLGSAGAQAVTLTPAITRALELIHRERSALPLHELAARCGLSPTHLSRSFHRELGVPLRNYRCSVRLSRFWEHYRSGTSVLDAALDAGFGSYAQFYKVFAAAYGQGPRTYLAGNHGRAL